MRSAWFVTEGLTHQVYDISLFRGDRVLELPEWEDVSNLGGPVEDISIVHSSPPVNEQTDRKRGEQL